MESGKVLSEARKQALEEKLQLQLLPSYVEIDLNGGIARWHDYHGVTFGDSPAEQGFIDAWILRIISSKVGYRVRLVKQGDSGNGRCWMSFIRD